MKGAHVDAVVAVNRKGTPYDAACHPPMPTKPDTRFRYLLRLRKEADRDVRRYVAKRWPVNGRVRFKSHGVVKLGTVHAHKEREIVVNVDRRLYKLPYERIIQHGNSK